MTNRITKKQLQFKMDYIIRNLDRPVSYWDADQNINVGHIHIDYYNPGGNPYAYQIAEIININGGVRNWTNYRMTVREFDAYLTGIVQALELKDSAPRKKVVVNGQVLSVEA